MALVNLGLAGLSAFGSYKSFQGAARTPTGQKVMDWAKSVKEGRPRVPSANTKVINTPEVKAPNAIKSSDVIKSWDDYLGPNQTNINPRTGQVDSNRISSSDGKKSIRFGSHEMNSVGTSKAHYHIETWAYDPVTDTMTVTNILQRIK